MSLQALNPTYPQVGNYPGVAFDPFTPVGGGPIQSGRLKAYVRITISGMPVIGVSGAVDVTEALAPYLLSVRCKDGYLGSDYNCEIELDDRDAQLPIPPLGAHINIAMGWLGEGPPPTVWDGEIKEVEHGCARKEGGRRMWIHGAGDRMLSNAKEPQQDDHGEGAPAGQNEGSPIPLMSALSAAAGRVGHSIAMAPKFQSLTRDYIAQANESFYHFGNRIADEIGGFFRVVGGNQAEINAHDQMATGPRPTVVAQWGYNLISWRVKPMAAKPAWSGSNQQYFDHLKGQWKFFSNKLNLPDPFGFADALFALPRPAGNASNAQQDNSGTAGEVAAGIGPGRIVINGEPNAHGGGYVNLIGARPGVDGTYLIFIAEHLYSREGYVTWLDVYVQTTGGSTTVNGTNYQLATRLPLATPTAPNLGTGFGGGSTVTTPPASPTSNIAGVPTVGNFPGGDTPFEPTPAEQQTLVGGVTGP